MVVREGLAEKVAVEQRLKGGEKGSNGDCPTRRK